MHLGQPHLKPWCQPCPDALDRRVPRCCKGLRCPAMPQRFAEPHDVADALLGLIAGRAPRCSKGRQCPAMLQRHCSTSPAMFVAEPHPHHKAELCGPIPRPRPRLPPPPFSTGRPHAALTRFPLNADVPHVALLAPASLAESSDSDEWFSGPSDAAGAFLSASKTRTNKRGQHVPTRIKCSAKPWTSPLARMS